MGNNENLNQLYREVILDHHRSPRGSEELSDPEIETVGFNPVCGDKLKLQVKVNKNGVIEKVGCLSEGCSISVASASIMAEEIQGKKVEDARAMVEKFRSMMAGKDSINSQYGDLEALEGVKMFPVRIKCALLPWATLANGIDRYEGKTTDDVAKTE